MAETKIEWADYTFNPWVGCTKLSPACDHCYAESWAKRTGNAHLWQGERRQTSPANWKQPLKWDREAAAVGERHRVFCASLADVFDNQVPERWREDLWALIRTTPNLDWLLLTKRPQNITKMLPPDWRGGYLNVWLGTTVENQEEADRRIPHLLSVPARVRFLSCEPLLGPVDLTRLDVPAFRHKGGMSCLSSDRVNDHSVDWVITGGESGPKARPMHPDWARSLRDQCAAAGVAFHFKQWGEYQPLTDWRRAPSSEHVTFETMPRERVSIVNSHNGSDIVDLRAAEMARVGKKAAGRLLDGREWNEFPA